MTTCPLPIEWLDFVDGEGSPEMAAHREACASCREVVDSLKHAVRLRSDWSTQLRLPRLAIQEETKPAEARPGEIWLSLSSFRGENWGYAGVNRLFLVVLDTGPEEAGSGWYQVAPMWTDTENADSTDLLLQPADTTLGGHWRLILGLQALVKRGQLDSRIGELTETGRKLLSALEGELPIERIGTELEGGDDPRLAANSWIESAVALLNTVHLAEAEVEEQNEASPEPPRSRGVRLMQMTLSEGPSPRQQLAWAAQSEMAPTLVQVRLVHGDALLEGHLEYDNNEDAVALVVDQARGWERPIRIFFAATEKSADTIAGPLFPLESGIRVVLVKGLGILPKQIRTVWAEVEL